MDQRQGEDNLEIPGQGGYNKDTLDGEEVIDVEEIRKKVQQVYIPPHLLRQLGLSPDWVKQVSDEFIKRVVVTAKERKRVLEELAKY
ncbi:MAG TPA: hypothetical protein GXX51_10130 [Firmicutes bacterium]|nr:hypothetical protein [Bacillota bacterium]